MTIRGKDENGELRQKAEHLIARTNAAAEDLTGMPPQQIAGLVHELRVHQVELKMQNDELRRIQAELENARDRYLHLYDFAPTAYFSVDEKGTVTEANLTAATLLDRPRNTLAGQMFSRFIHRDDQDIWYLHRKHLLETGNFQSPQVRLVKSDGGFFYAKLQCMLVEESGGERKAIRIAATDVTSLKQAEQALQQSNATLRESEEKFRALFDHSQVAVLLTIPDGTIEAANPAAAAMFGCSEEEICAMGRSAIFDASDPRLADVLKERQFEGRLKSVELTAIRKGGKTFPAEVDSVTLPVGPKRSFVIIRDITKRKNAEKAMRESEARLSVILNELPLAVGVFNKEGRTTLKNDLMQNNIPDTLPSHDPDWRKRWHAVDSDGTPIPPDR